MDVQIIYYIISGCVGLVLLIASIIIRCSKNSKAVKSAQAVANHASQFLELLNGAKECMFNTEEMSNFTAKEKHEYCRTLIIDFCIKHDIDYSQYDIDQVIEYFMEVGNVINAREKEDKGD